MIHAIAAGAAVICFAQSASPVRASDGDLSADDPPPLVAASSTSDFSPTVEETPAFVWQSDLAVAPPPYVTTVAADSPLVAPLTTTTAIPLPPGAWTGLASLAGLGAIAFVRHLRRAH
jgi:hypothetical protein